MKGFFGTSLLFLGFLVLGSEAFSLAPRIKIASSAKTYDAVSIKKDLIVPLFASENNEDSGKVVSSLPGWDPTNWTAPRFWNSLPFRSVALLSVLAITMKSGGINLSSSIASSIHLFSFATWFGTMFYTTFIFGITAFKVCSRLIKNRVEY